MLTFVIYPKVIDTFVRHKQTLFFTSCMHYFIRFITRFIPRRILQRLSCFTLRIIDLFCRGNRYIDPINNISYRKLLPYGRIQIRKNALAPRSMSLERHRLIWLYLRNKTDFFTAPLKVLHIAPEHCFIKKFKQLKNLSYITADIESPWADVKMDIRNIPFPGNTFDVIICNHVFEHIVDDAKAMQETFRVLKPNGWAIFQVPVNWDKPTFEDPSITDPKEREKMFGQRDHVRYYGHDYPDRLQRAGFTVSVINYAKELGQDNIKKYALLPEEKIVFCSKQVKETS